MSHIPLSETYLVETTWTVLWANPGYRDETPMINYLRIHRFIDTINCRATHFLARQPLVGQSLITVEASQSRSDTTLRRSLLDERSARRRGFYLTTQNTHNRHPCPSRDSSPQTHVLARPMASASD
jgi:hypothetical protein